MKKLFYFLLFSISMFFPLAGNAQFDFVGEAESPSTIAEAETVSLDSHVQNNTADIIKAEKKINEPANIKEKSSGDNKTQQKEISNESDAVVTPTKKEYNILNPKPRDFIDEYIENAETTAKARRDTLKMIEHRPEEISLRASQKKLIEEGNKKREIIKQKVDNTKKELQKDITAAFTKEEMVKEEEEEEKEKENVPSENIETEIQATNKEEVPEENSLVKAPFGLYWNASQEEIKNLGFELSPATRDEYQNVFAVKNSEQNNRNFPIITAIFGIQNHLWCIYAQSNYIDDTPSAEKALELYHIYFKALEQKYGNPQEHFTPFTYTKEIVQEENKEQIITMETKENPIGGDTFLQELQENKAALYSTFSDGKIGVTLGISTNDIGQSYIYIDYKNLPIMQQEEEIKLNNLISDI